MRPEKRLFGYSILYLFALFARAGRRPLAVRMTPDDQELVRRRQRERAPGHGAGCSARSWCCCSPSPSPRWRSTDDQRSPERNRRVALRAGAVGLAMLGLAFAAVPLYRMFCQVTGFGGTTAARRRSAPGRGRRARSGCASTPTSTPALPWGSSPSRATVRIQPGARTTIFYRATNSARADHRHRDLQRRARRRPGQYFSKIECFCFTEQTLRPGERVQHAGDVLRRSQDRSTTRTCRTSRRSR